MAIEKVLILFLDGIGLGDDTEANPFMRHKLPFVDSLLGGRRIWRGNAGYSNAQATLLGLDATLGISGLPQSGTGQTAILTGLNAPQSLGRHYGPYPNDRLKSMLADHSLFTRLLARNHGVAYAGAYPEQFHKRLERKTERISANTRAAVSAGLKLRGLDELAAGRAVSGLLTNQHWRNWGHDLPLLTPSQAGANLVRLTEDHALTYFEFWYTDVVGHKQDMAQAEELLTLLDGFIAGITHAIDPTSTLFLIISDHGNLEDLSTKQHTTNPALALAIGADHHLTGQRLHTTMDIAPLVLDLLG